VELHNQDQTVGSNPVPPQGTGNDILDGAGLPPVPESTVLGDPQADRLNEVAGPVIVAENAPVVSAQTSTPVTTPAAEASAAAVEQASGKFDRSKFVEPTPSPFLIDFMGPLNRYLLLEGLPIVKHIPLLNQLPFARGLMKVPNINFPAADVAELREAINPETVAFVGPNHPEFLTDWLIDKEVACQVSPYMAHWAAQEIVNADPYTQAFWLKNNLIANVSNGGGKEYSLNWAMQGHGVLLHPEGTVHWTGDRVQKIFPGIVDMAMDAARRVLATPQDTRPVYIVPVVWKLYFNHDVSSGLQSEMKGIEKKLRLPLNSKMEVMDRFVALQSNILASKEKQFGLINPAPITAQNFFERQEQLFAHLEEDLGQRYGTQHGDERRRTHLFDKASRVNKESNRDLYKADQKKVAEMNRLLGFGRETYNTPELTQEHIAESLKRIRKDLVMHTWLDRLKKTAPVPVGERTAEIRSAGPIEVRSLMSRPNVDEEALRDELVAQVRTYMQTRLDQINKEIAPEVQRFARINPFYRP
jgi:hypothetical protein